MLPPFASLAAPGTAGKPAAPETSGRPVADDPCEAASDAPFAEVLSAAGSARGPASAPASPAPQPSSGKPTPGLAPWFIACGPAESGLPVAGLPAAAPAVPENADAAESRPAQDEESDDEAAPSSPGLELPLFFSFARPLPPEPSPASPALPEGFSASEASSSDGHEPDPASSRAACPGAPDLYPEKRDARAFAAASGISARMSAPVPAFAPVPVPASGSGAGSALPAETTTGAPTSTPDADLSFAPSATVDAGTGAGTGLRPAGKPLAEAADSRPAVFAAPASPRFAGADDPVGDFGKNVFQSSDGKGLKYEVFARGMEKAKDSLAMSSASVLHDPAFAAPAGVAEASSKGASEWSSPFASLSVAPDLAAGPVETPAATPTPAAAAVRLIERVEQLAERLEARPGDPIRLSLDLEGDHRVDVKVSFRGGRLFADFRSDSPEMRAALAQGWDAFVRGQDSAARRWADPVISAGASAAPVTPSSAPSASGQDAFQNPAASDQQRSPRHGGQAPDAAPSFLVRGAPSRASATSVPETSPAPRGDASRLLSARA